MPSNSASLSHGKTEASQISTHPPLLCQRQRHRRVHWFPARLRCQHQWPAKERHDLRTDQWQKKWGRVVRLDSPHDEFRSFRAFRRWDVRVKRSRAPCAFWYLTIRRRKVAAGRAARAGRRRKIAGAALTLSSRCKRVYRTGVVSRSPTAYDACDAASATWRSDLHQVILVPCTVND